ncbi:MAG: type III pantothenate kinase [Clostridiales bacterium]|nr:type III pantothenate kinase [Clostridiales bacterium]
MLLGIDIGNTNITLGLFEGDALVYSFRLTTKTPRTSDEYGIILEDLLKSKNIKKEQIKDVIISSVVPGIMHSFNNSIKKYLDKKPFEIGVGTKTGINIVTPYPEQIGADRIVDAAAAYELYGGPLIVIDFGTATTYDLISEDGAFLAGITSPGIRICADALWEETAKLPEIEIKKPDSILAKETITSMQAGLVYGYIGQTEYIVKEIIRESKLENVKVISTGGFGKMIADETEIIDVYNPDLSLEGLRIIYNKNRR